jgi:hypothetical protein
MSCSQTSNTGNWVLILPRGSRIRLKGTLRNYSRRKSAGEAPGLLTKREHYGLLKGDGINYSHKGLGVATHGRGREVVTDKITLRNYSKKEVRRRGPEQ